MSKFRRVNLEDYTTENAETVVEKTDIPETSVAEKVYTEAPKAPEKKEPKVPQIARTIPDLTNIRKTPNANADIVSVVSKGAEFKVDAKKSTDEYVAISIQGEIAFIKKGLVTVFDDPAYKSNTVSKIG